jgi:putative phage-type endonuclease
MLTQKQLEMRKHGLGGSDAGVALGMSPFKTPLELWREKVGEAAAPDLSDNEAVRFGNLLEPVIAEEFSRRTGLIVHRVNDTIKHAEHPWMFANIDRRIVGQKAGLEIKTASVRSAHAWGDAGTDDVPMHYLAQCTHYMAVTEWPVWHVAVLLGGNELRAYRIERDPELERMMLDRLSAFWELVKTKTPPMPTTLSDAASLWPRNVSHQTAANDDALSVVLELKTLQEKSKVLDAQIDAAKLRLQTAMADAAELVGPDGKALATWKAQTATKFDTSKFKAAHPDLYAAFAYTSESRVFRVK